MKQKLEKVYEELGISEISLMNNCIFCSLCWKDLAEKHKKNSDWAIYLPYIGEKYEDARILFLGINMNGYGDEDAASNLAQDAIDEISRGKIRTFANPKDDYIGSLLWHRIFSYATFILREIAILKKPLEKPYPSIAEMKTAYDYIAMTNSIKCSPNGDNSKPTYSMWVNCPSYILKEELRILKPKHLIVLGLENYEHIKSLFSTTDKLTNGYVSVYKAQVQSENLRLYVIPHPSSSQGTAIARQDELEEILEECLKND